MAKRLQIQFYNESTGESLSLPINPADVSLPTEMNNQTYNIIDYGEVNRMGSRRVKQAVFRNLFPHDNSFLNLLPSTFSNILDNIFSIFFSQKDTIEKLESWEVNKNKIRVIVSDYYNELMQISRFEPVVAESNNAVHYTLEFIEYRDPATEYLLGKQTNILSSGLLARTAIRAIPSTVYAKASDDLYSLAKRYSGSGSNWQQLAKANNISDVSTNLVGKEINLPW